jgi:FkbM family methyltransferase
MQFYGHKGLDKHLYNKYFKDVKGGLCIEAGAYDGINMSSAYVLEQYNEWQCINVEPNPDLYRLLVNNRPKSINLNYGLSDVDGKLTMEIGKRSKNGHLSGKQGIMPHLRVLNPKNGGRGSTIKYEVETITYKSIVDRYAIKKVDLFVLDVEGWEIPTINGMKDCNVLPYVFCIESCPSANKEVNYESAINEVFKGMYKKDSSCWLNDIYVRK